LTRFASATRPCCRRSKSCWPPATARWCFFNGARNEGELLYGEEFEAFAQAHPGFIFHGCLSRQARALPRSTDRSGHVQNVLAELGPSAERDIAYLCGTRTWSTPRSMR
jgi:NAD(P)H-flavin reductase